MYPFKNFTAYDVIWWLGKYGFASIFARF